MNEFSTIFEKYEGYSIRQPKASLLIIIAFISKLLVLPSLMDIRNVQATIKLLFWFANTTLKKFTAHWDYQSATLIVCPSTRLWLATNNVLGSKWTSLDKQKLGPNPQETPIKGSKGGIVQNQRMLRIDQMVQMQRWFNGKAILSAQIQQNSN